MDCVTDVREVFRSWQDGTVIRSWLLDLAVPRVGRRPTFRRDEGLRRRLRRSRWTVEAAIDHAVPLPTIATALYARCASRQGGSQEMRLIAALRNEFGGHPVRSADGGSP